MMVSSPEDDESDDESTNPHTTITATTAASSRSPTLRAVKRAAVGPFKRPHKHLLLQRCHSAPTARSFGLYPFTAAPAPPHTASVALDLAVGAGVMTPQRVAVARVVDAYHLDGASLPSRVYTSMDVHAATPHTRKILEEYGAAGCAWGWDGGFGFGGRRRMIDGKTGLLAEPDINPFL
ncbi:hypothetical protein BC830DRAFT_1123357 [Chytriomyces sp. MP71]|nr:hypothetical protein BC830DRAFT_1123357 [Chytriomyces sp. MP71]